MILEKDTTEVYLAESLYQKLPSISERLFCTVLTDRVYIGWISGTKDIWCRDFMPVQICPDRFVQFNYDPDYIRDGAQNTRTAPEDIQNFLTKNSFHVTISDLRIDGGNVVSAGSKAFLTDKVFKENPRLSQQEVLDQLEKDLEATPVILPHEPYDPVGHSDGMLRHADGNHVLVNDYSVVSKSFRNRFLRSVRKAGFEYTEIPYFLDDPKNNIDPVVGSAVGNYVNYMRVGRVIVVPQYGSKQDEPAARAIEKAHPGVTIRTMDCKELARHGGVLSCISWCIKN